MWRGRGARFARCHFPWPLFFVVFRAVNFDFSSRVRWWFIGDRFGRRSALVPRLSQTLAGINLVVGRVRPGSIPIYPLGIVVGMVGILAQRNG